MDWILLLGFIVAGWLWAGQISFIEDIKNLIWIGSDKKRNFKNKVINYLYNQLHHLINCNCIIFWIGWIYGGIIFGLLSYAGSELLGTIINYLKQNTYYD
jgi:hypothetical protein